MSPKFSTSVQTTRKITRRFSFFSALFLLGMTLLTFFSVRSGDLTLEIEVGDDTILNPYFATVLFYLLLQLLLSGIVFALSLPMVCLWKIWRGTE
jgi:hypothetical protein